MYNVIMRPTKKEVNNRGIELLNKFHALDDPNRIRILNIISSGFVLSEKEILRELEISQSTLSHHLDILTKAHLLKCSRKNHKALYMINTTSLLIIDSFLAYLHEKFEKACDKYKNGPTFNDIYNMVEDEEFRKIYYRR